MQRKIDYIFGFWTLALLLAPLANVRAQELRFSGFLQLDKRFNVSGDSIATLDFYNRFRLEMAVGLNEQLYMFSSLDFRFYDLPRASTLAGLENLDQVFPTDLSLWEAYVDIFGFLTPDLDIRAGKQRIAWGTADRLNPTDNLNPDDFSDLVNFTEKIPTWAIKANYYLGDFTLTGVWLPALTPMLLPRSGATLFLSDPAAAFQDSLLLPGQELKNSMLAFKLSSRLGIWDYSVSYFYGYDDIPILRGVNVALSPENSTTLELGFPKMQVIGLDFAAELGGIGVWGEGAVFFPEEVVSQARIGDVVYPTVELDGKPYFKFTVGGDYTFPGGIYVNAQWMHGFFTERGASELHDYFFLQTEKKLFRDKVKLLLAGGGEVADWSRIGETFGYGVFPEIAYLAIDNLELALGTFIVGGKPATLFGAWKETSQTYLRFKVNF